MKKQSFITGAIILMIANAISKILGAVFKIPLTYILNEEGMAVFNIAFDVYIMFLSFIISGLPFAISKLVAESSSRKEFEKVHKTVKVSTILLVIIGLMGSVVLYVGASFFALAMKEEKAVYAIQMIAPSVFFVALGTAYKSYYQGTSNMIPPAVSQVVESATKLVVGYYLAVIFTNMGIEKTTGGAVMGVTAGEIIATAILMGAYLWERNKTYIISDDTSSREIVKELLSIALPLLCTSVVTSAINVADTTLIRSRLLDGGFTQDETRFLYGAYTGYALTVFHLPVGILATLGVSILPVIAGAVAVENMSKAQAATDIGIRLAVILSLPCAVLMCTMSTQILNILFNNDTSNLMLSVVSPCVVMMCVSQITASILQSAGKIMEPFYNALIGSLIKIVLSYYLVAIPKINIYGSAISANIAYTVVMILNLFAIRRNLGLKQNIMEIMIKPVISSAVMVLVIKLLSAPLESLITNTFLYLAVMCIVSCTAYVMMLYVTQAVSVKEVRKLLKG